MKTVMITGATGFMGMNLVQRLSFEPEKYRLVTVGRKAILGNDMSHVNHVVCDLSETDGMFNRACVVNKPDVIIHLAGNAVPNTGGIAPFGMVQDNIVSTMNVINSSPDNCRIIFASSVVVYGDWMYSQLHQTPYYERHKTEPTSIYGLTKRASESLIENYTNWNRISGCSLRFCATVGKGVTHGIVKDFIAKLIKGFLISKCYSVDRRTCDTVFVY